MKFLTGLVASVACLVAGSANAVTIFPTFVAQGFNTTTAQSTLLYRANLSGFGLTEIAMVRIQDSNSGVGGSPGAYSGFDLDSVFLDADGDASTVGDQIYASSFLFNAGTLRPGGLSSPTAGPTSGSASSTTVDESFATLNSVDAIFFGAGSLTLGDGGTLTALFQPAATIPPEYYLFVGEVSGDAGETVTGAVQVSDRVTVPAPATAVLLLSGLGAIALRKYIAI